MNQRDPDRDAARAAVHGNAAHAAAADAHAVHAAAPDREAAHVAVPDGHAVHAAAPDREAAHRGGLGRRASRTTFVFLGIAALALGGAVLVYRGPGQPFVRGHVGDVAATMLVFALLSLGVPRARATVRAAVTMAIATAVEVSQISEAVQSRDSVLLGATFDWVDLGAYVVGIGIAVAWERLVVSSPRWTPELAGREPRCSALAGSRFGEPSAPVAQASSIAPSTSSSDARSR